MDWSAAFASGRIVELVIAVTLAEGLVLAVLHARTGRGVAPRDYALNLLSGLCLMAALRAVLLGQGWMPQAGWLAVAGAAHGADLWSRWRRR